MKTRIIIALFLLCNFFSYAQEQNIILPSSDYEKKLRMRSLSIYVHKNGTILMENDTVTIGEFKMKLFSTPKPRIDYTPSIFYKEDDNIQIIADKQTPYKIIDAIKTEIAESGRAKTIIYRTDSGEDKTKKGITFLLPFSFFNTRPQERLVPRKYIKRRDSIEMTKKKLKLIELQDEIRVDSIMPKVMEIDDPAWTNHSLTPLYPFPRSYTYERVAYSIKQTVINEKFEGVIRKCITIKNDGIYSHGNKIANLNFEDIKKLLSNNKALFVYTNEDLTYENYIKFVEVLPEFISLHGFPKGNYARVIEMTNQIKTINDSFDIRLCD